MSQMNILDESLQAQIESLEQRVTNLTSELNSRNAELQIINSIQQATIF